MFNIRNLFKKQRNYKICISAFAIGKNSFYGSAIHSLQHIYKVLEEFEFCTIVCPTNFKKFLEEKLPKNQYKRIIFNKQFEMIANKCPLIFKPFFTGFFIPLYFNKDIIFCLDDSGPLVPFVKSIVLMHNPISFYDIKELKERKERRNILYIIVFKFYLKVSFLVSKSIYLVQSSHMKKRLIKNYALKDYKVKILDIYNFSKVYYPNIYLNAKYTLKRKSNNYRKFLQQDLNFKYRGDVLVPITPRPQKNIQLVVKIAKMVKDFRFLITSSEENLLTYFKSKKSDIRPENLFCTGFLDHAELCSLMAEEKTKVVFFPSKLETFGLPILESYLLDKYVVVPNDPVFEIHSFEKCLKFKMNNTRSCLNKINEILNN